MMKTVKRLLTLVALSALWPAIGMAGETATPQEVISKVREAAAYLEKKGSDGLNTFNTVDSPYAWKDTYVFVFNCGAGLADVATPLATAKEQSIAIDKDADGKVVGPSLCKAAERPGGSWVAYKWWKPTRIEGAPQMTHGDKTLRKVSYMLQVKGQPFQVGAGIYNETVTISELDALLKK